MTLENNASFRAPFPPLNTETVTRGTNSTTGSAGTDTQAISGLSFGQGPSSAQANRATAPRSYQMQTANATRATYYIKFKRC